MIKYIEKLDGLDVLYNNELIISHTLQKPVAELGYGHERIDSHIGNFEINDSIEIRIELENYKVIDNTVTFYHKDVELVIEFQDVDNRLEMNLKSTEGYNRFWMKIFAHEDEKVYGCGEQASYFNLRNRNYPLWTSEPGVGRDKTSPTTLQADLHSKSGGDYYNTYYPEPTFISTRRYWFHADSFAYSEFNFINSEYHELLFWDVPKSIIISFANSYLDLVEDLTDFTGRVPELPDFLLDGMILGVQGGLETVLDYLKIAEDADVKVSGLWCQDWAGYRHTTLGKRLFWNWIINENMYPNLKKEISRLNDKNVSFLSYICPFLLENESLFNYAQLQGYLALNKKNQTYKVDFGEFYCGIVDLTNPQAFKWFKNIIKDNIIGLGIKGWMADFGEYLPVDCVLHNKVDAKLMHNKWPVLWAQCNYEAVEESGKIGEVFYFMRAGAHKSQHYATSLWAGDQSVNWELHDGIASVIPSALSAGIIGNPFTHSDIGGYTSLYGNVRTKELFDRWLEMNVFTAYMRTHEGNRPPENFQFYQDEDTLRLMSRMTNIRVDLKPYIKTLIKEGSAKGYPVQRPMFMHYEDDLSLYDLQYQYLFGSDILVKPVVNQGQAIQQVYLPEDTWVHMWTGIEYSGKQVAEVECPFGSPPVFYRKNSPFRHLFEEITRKYLI